MRANVRGHSPWLLLILIIGSAWLLSGADWSADQNGHLVVSQLRDQSCQSALQKAANKQPERLHLVRRSWLPLYELSAPPSPTVSLNALWDESTTLWANGYFEEAVQRSAPLLPALHSRADYALRTGRGRALQSLAQLRIALHLLEGRDAEAASESDLLLSRHSAELYCADTEFPEACALLRRREKLAPLYWSISDSDRETLRSFADHGARLLSTVSQPAPNEVLWESLVDGAPSHQLLRRGDCAERGFWSAALTEWEIELHALRFPQATPREARPLLRGAMWAGVGISAAFTIAAITRSAQLRPRQRQLDRCIESGVVCPTERSIQTTYGRWKRAQRQTGAFWAGALIAGSATIPLQRVSRPRTDAPSSIRVTPVTPRDEWAQDAPSTSEGHSALGDGLTPE